MAALAAGPIGERTGPRCGIHCSNAPRIAHSGAKATPMIHNPASYKTPAAIASSIWATNQRFSAVQVVSNWVGIFMAVTRKLYH